MVRLARSIAVAVLATFVGFAAPVTAQPVNPNELIILTTTTTGVLCARALDRHDADIRCSI